MSVGKRVWAQKHKLIRRSFFGTTLVANKLGLVEKELCELIILRWDGLMRVQGVCRNWWTCRIFILGGEVRSVYGDLVGVVEFQNPRCLHSL